MIKCGYSIRNLTRGLFDFQLAIGHSQVAWVHDQESGLLQGLLLPGSDVEQMVRGLYDNLKALIETGHSLQQYVAGLIDTSILFPGLESDTPYREICLLPTIVSPEQKRQLAEVLTEKSGVIDLSGLSKVDASTVVVILNERLRRSSGDLSTDDRRKVTIKYKDGEFGWVSEGTRGGREQDQAAHLYRSANSKPSPSISQWRSGLPE